MRSGRGIEVAGASRASMSPAHRVFRIMTNTTQGIITHWNTDERVRHSRNPAIPPDMKYRPTEGVQMKVKTKIRAGQATAAVLD
jgi:hypothetical protein